MPPFCIASLYFSDIFYIIIERMICQKWEKCKIWVTALLLFGFCFLLGNVKKSVALSEEDIIKSAIEKKIKSNVYVNAVYYLDYDKKRRKEAFDLMGKKDMFYQYRFVPMGEFR